MRFTIADIRRAYLMGASMENFRLSGVTNETEAAKTEDQRQAERDHQWDAYERELLGWKGVTKTVRQVRDSTLAPVGEAFQGVDKA
jgi:hypothetical protein